ncbi:hypothetical protein [Leuconostoc lactis]|uniref:hypothetical protein n=1 Tax=Leuconostoc lactis TaxID=1246 RepID=UPI00241F3FDA|nr:hypothetical protein [Leuconostoc lactis]
MTESQEVTKVNTNQLAIPGTCDKITIGKGVIEFKVSVDLSKNAHLLEKLSREAGNQVLIGLSFQQQELNV